MAYKILVVDDESHYADMLRDLLLQSNFIADMVTSVAQAIDALDSEEYALIIADFKMPGMDGGEFLQRVRQRNLTIPFFMVSGLMNTHELIRVANSGVTLVFEKPLEINEFMQAVRRYVTPLSDVEFQKRFRSDLTAETYPNELVHLSDKSPLGRAFVEHLWDAYRHERQVILRSYPGSEIELIAREVSHWKGRSQAEFYTLTPDILSNPDCVQALNAVVDDHAVSPVLILDGLDAASDEDLATLCEFLLGRHIMPALHRDLFFIVLVDGTDNGERLARRHPTLGTLIKSTAITLAPLRERPADIARHARALLARYAREAGDTAKAWLTPEAVGCILQYPWFGEYDELAAKLRELVSADRPVPLDVETLAKHLRDVESDSGAEYTLARRLLLAQEQCMASALDSSDGDRLSALTALGVPAEIAEALPPGDLAYPELLK